jgi:hypothetical protein
MAFLQLMQFGEWGVGSGEWGGGGGDVTCNVSTITKNYQIFKLIRENCISGVGYT